ncbi:MAG: hypothetical protein R2828_31350 [Saprospiraceae bacterium]
MYLENEVSNMFQAVIAMDGLKEMYIDHYAQLWQEKKQLDNKNKQLEDELNRVRELASKAMEGEALYLDLLTSKIA